MWRCPEGLPWHRVVAANGQPGGDPAGQRFALQWAMLADEGVLPDRRSDGGAGQRIDLLRYGWRPGEDRELRVTDDEVAR